jgi:hypothetical protein
MSLFATVNVLCIYRGSPTRWATRSSISNARRFFLPGQWPLDLQTHPEVAGPMCICQRGHRKFLVETSRNVNLPVRLLQQDFAECVAKMSTSNFLLRGFYRGESTKAINSVETGI